MILSWLRATEKTDDVNALIARKDYKAAIAALRGQLQKDPQNVFARQQLADAYVAAGDKNQALTILERLADDFARDGFAAKSISVLKKIQRIEPGRPSIDSRLAEAIQQTEEEKRKMMIRPRARKLESIDDFVPPTPSSRPAPPPVAPMKDLPAKEHAPSRSQVKPESWLDRVNAAGVRELEVEVDVEKAAAPTNRDVAADAHESDSMSVIPNVLTTPLFASFSPEELVSVIRSLDLRTFEAGDIIVGEGEEGDSLFILTSGVVKAFVKNPRGRQRKVREMVDGDFFGEISLLHGGPRTATITAATTCDLLELSSAAVEELAAQHPNVKEILNEFSNLRAGSEAESAARSE